MCNPIMRIETSGRFEYRDELYRETAERFGVGTKVGGIDAACEWSRRMIDALDDAADHPDMTADLAKTLSTPRVRVVYSVDTGLNFRGKDE